MKKKQQELLEYEKLRDKQLELKKEYEESLGKNSRLKLDIENLIREIKNKLNELEFCLVQSTPLLEELNYDKEDILKIIFDESLLRKKLGEIESNIEKYTEILEESNPESPNFKIKQYQKSIDFITSAFTGEHKAYQIFLYYERMGI